MADERPAQLIGALIDHIRRFIVDKQVTVPEYMAAVSFALELAKEGKIPILADCSLSRPSKP